MRGTTIGAIAGIAAACILLQFGFWGLLLAIVLGAIGWLVGGWITGTLDVRGAVAALRGRRVG